MEWVFEGFSDDGLRVLVSARDEAKLLGHDYIGTEHLLLGLMSDVEGRPFAALTACGVDVAALQVLVRDLGSSAGAGTQYCAACGATLGVVKSPRSG